MEILHLILVPSCSYYVFTQNVYHQNALWHDKIKLADGGFLLKTQILD